VAAMTAPAGSNKDDLGDLGYDASLTHRLTIQISGNAPGTGTNTPTGVQTTSGVPLKGAVDVIYDFIPATGKPVTSADAQRDIVASARPASRATARWAASPATAWQAPPRSSTAAAATLTFSGSTYIVDGRAVGNLPNHIHKIHAGKALAKNAYNYGGVVYDEHGYPQDIRNCQKCHSGSGPTPTLQGDNWKSVPSRLACGACHDGINFATGQGVTLADAAAGKTSSPYGHIGGVQTDDSACAICHKAASIEAYHLPVTPPNVGSALHVAGGNANTNSAWIASNTSRLPEGAIRVTYNLKSVSVNASGQPVMVFRIMANGARKDFNAFASAAVNPASGQKEMWNNFMGSPSAYFVWAVPQDGIADPADFNASASGYLRNIWSGTATGTGAGMLAGPDGDGYPVPDGSGLVAAGPPTRRAA